MIELITSASTSQDIILTKSICEALKMEHPIWAHMVSAELRQRKSTNMSPAEYALHRAKYHDLSKQYGEEPVLLQAMYEAEIRNGYTQHSFGTKHYIHPKNLHEKKTILKPDEPLLNQLNELPIEELRKHFRKIHYKIKQPIIHEGKRVVLKNSHHPEHYEKYPGDPTAITRMSLTDWREYACDGFDACQTRGTEEWDKSVSFLQKIHGLPDELCKELVKFGNQLTVQK